MKRGSGTLLGIVLAISLATSACATATQTPAPTTSAQPAKASEATKPATAATKAPETSKPAAERPPVRVGYIIPLSGPSAGVGVDMKDAFNLYVEEKGGTLGGRKFELLIEDDENNAQAGLTKAKKLVERDNVQMIGGIISTASAYAVGDYMKTQKIPLFINNAGADDLTKERFVPQMFRNSFANSQMVHPFGEWVYKRGFRKAALVATDYAAGYEYTGGFARTFTAAGGTIVQEQYPPLGVPDPSPFISALSSEADFVFLFQTDPDALRFVPAYDQYGMKQKLPLFGAASVTDEPILPRQGDSALGIISAVPWSAALDTPANKAFVASYEKKYNRSPSFTAAEGYESAMILDRALQSIGGNIEDSDAFIKAMEKVELADGPRGPIKFDSYHNVVKDIYVVEVKKVDGKLQNTVIDTFKGVSQFWKWSPDEYTKMTSYDKLKGTWVK